MASEIGSSNPVDCYYQWIGSGKHDTGNPDILWENRWFLWLPIHEASNYTQIFFVDPFSAHPRKQFPRRHGGTLEVSSKYFDLDDRQKVLLPGTWEVWDGRWTFPVSHHNGPVSGAGCLWEIRWSAIVTSQLSTTLQGDTRDSRSNLIWNACRRSV